MRKLAIGVLEDGSLCRKCLCRLASGYESSAGFTGDSITIHDEQLEWVYVFEEFNTGDPDAQT